MELKITAKIEINDQLRNELIEKLEHDRRGVSKEDARYYDELINSLENYQEVEFAENVKHEIKDLLLLGVDGFSARDGNTFWGYKEA